VAVHSVADEESDYYLHVYLPGDLHIRNDYQGKIFNRMAIKQGRYQKRFATVT